MMQKIKQIIKQIICSLSPCFKCSQNESVEASIIEITPLEVKAHQAEFRRLNLVVPSINKKDIFGGISTAIAMFEKMLEILPSDFHARIILTETSVDSPVRNFSDYTISSLGQDNHSRLQVVACNDRYAKELPIVKHDVFLTTAWWTTHITQNIIKKQKAFFGSCYPLIYLIQDFEPCFYNWSARYALAEATYKGDVDTIAIINSKELSDYMLNKGYQFHNKYYFLPKMNNMLKKNWKLRNPKSKKKQLIVYGRPSTDRNLFPIILSALKIWVFKQADISEWTLLSLGEEHKDIDLGNGAVLVSKGKLSLDGYSTILEESSLGLSLMLSPHPSYPPLEMAYFGALTITNKYENKDLSGMHENLISVDSCNPSSIATKLLAASTKVSGNINIGNENKIKDKSYIDEHDQFHFLKNTAQDLSL
jgi:O-antigen biosynthesis protein